jgi:hypothetical protein
MASRGVLAGRSSFSPAQDETFADLVYFKGEVRDFELVIEYEASGPGTLLVGIRMHATSEGILKEGVRLALPKAKGTAIITLDGGDLFSPGSDQTLEASVPEYGRIVLGLMHGAKVRITKLRLKRLE